MIDNGWTMERLAGALRGLREDVDEALVQGIFQHEAGNWLYAFRRRIAATEESAQEQQKEKLPEGIPKEKPHAPVADPQAQEGHTMDIFRFEQAPCYLCGYNGPGYYQTEQHKCATEYHRAIDLQLEDVEQAQDAMPETDAIVSRLALGPITPYDAAHQYNTLLDLARTLERQRNAERAARHDDELRWRTWCTIEVMIRNPQVFETVKHWEDRTTVAEAKVDELTRSVQCSAIEGEEVGNPCTLYKDMERRLAKAAAALNKCDEQHAGLQQQLAEAKVRITELQFSIGEQKQMLAEADARINLLEADMQSGAYETLYAQTLAELQDAKQLAEQYKANAERYVFWRAHPRSVWVIVTRQDGNTTLKLDTIPLEDWDKWYAPECVDAAIDAARGKP